ncbi:peptidoglycan-binding protein [Chryseobacterium sp. Leaf404]|uniref:peptidoglycan-binding domain-containing protein n=1 Tax=unclassified Chryseobacterium TaxID=2593645 RepID=UPI0006FF82AF|nr:MULTISPECIES: peptidoglycan-binding domain-containing protein [unclassified Chryseobacterium]KQT17905.1 peptidoglycan-binding protein [Chryseobacterium sp. Leaf404]
MKKTQYLKELSLSAATVRKGLANKKADVEKIQSWLCLQERQHRGIGTMTGIDGDYGPATEVAVKNYQKFLGLPADGIVTPPLFSKLCLNIKSSFETASRKANLRETISEVAHHHLKGFPFELVIKQQTNCGPWVRSYMGGNEGSNWLWCMGFVQAILDQATSLHGKNFTDMMPVSYSCDTVGSHGIQKNVLIRNEKLRINSGLAKKGDVLLVRKSQSDWIHTAIIVDIIGDTFITIEGNTNNDGSSNGDGVYKRVRNFRKSPLDVFSIENWAK